MEVKGKKMIPIIKQVNLTHSPRKQKFRDKDEVTKSKTDEQHSSDAEKRKWPRMTEETCQVQTAMLTISQPCSVQLQLSSEQRSRSSVQSSRMGLTFGDSSSCLDESSHRWIPARTSTALRCQIVGGPWVNRSGDQPVSSSSSTQKQKLCLTGTV